MNAATLESSQTIGACRNCDAQLGNDQHYCGVCGQRIGAERLTLGEIAHDFLHALTHADHSIFVLMKELLLRPGHVAREHVDGRRKKYFGPFAFLVIMVGIASFLIAISGIQWFAPINDPRSAGLLQRHINLVILLQMPLLAAWCVLLFPRPRLNYAEHVVLAAYTSGFRVTVLALVATPVMYFAQLSTANISAGWVYYGAWVAYFAFAAVQFYGGRAWWTIIRAVFAALLSQATVFVLIFVFIYVFARL